MLNTKGNFIKHEILKFIMPLMFALLPGLFFPGILKARSFAQIKQSGILRVCTTGDYPPLTKYRDGRYYGVAIKQARTLARHLDLSIDFIKTTWTQLNSDLAKNKCDIAMGG